MNVHQRLFISFLFLLSLPSRVVSYLVSVISGLDSFGCSTSFHVAPREFSTLLGERRSSPWRERGFRDESRLPARRSLDTRHHDELLNTYLASCIPGLAPVLAEELRHLGCQQVKVTASSAVHFLADTVTALQVLIWTRTAHRVMELLVSSSTDDQIQDRHTLYQFVRDCIPVNDLLRNGQDGGWMSLSVQVKLNSNVPVDLNHSHFSALTIKNALVDSARQMTGERPSVELDHPDVPLVAVLWGQQQRRDASNCVQVSLYRQLHTSSLHKRGYRQQGPVHKAAMKETMAAGLLLQAGWPEYYHRSKKEKPVVLVDPMCGSGSLLLEAAMMAADLAPGLMRIRCRVPGSEKPPVVHWAHNDNQNIHSEWRRCLLEARQRAKNGFQRLRTETGEHGPTLLQIHGNDIHPGALDLFENSLQMAGLEHLVQIHEGDCLDLKLESTGSPWLVLTNPPWGVRLSEAMHESWEALRVFVRETCPPGSEVWVLSGNKSATKHLGLRRNQSLALKTGQQDLRWIQYLLRDPSGKTNEGQRKGKSGSDQMENEWLI